MNIASRPLRIPDSKLAREVREIVRDTESELLFNHSSRVYLFGALAGERRGLNSIRNCSMREPCFTTWV